MKLSEHPQQASGFIGTADRRVRSALTDLEVTEQATFYMGFTRKGYRPVGVVADEKALYLATTELSALPYTDGLAISIGSADGGTCDCSLTTPDGDVQFALDIREARELKAVIDYRSGASTQPPVLAAGEHLVDRWSHDLFPASPGRYKVISMKDRFFGGKFNPEVIQNALNSYSEEGWRLVNAVTADIPGGLAGARNEMVFILERATWDDKVAASTYSLARGVLFLTDSLPEFAVAGSVEANINRQNAQLRQLRDHLAAMALAQGANVVTHFSNSQHGSKPLALINPFKWDTEYLSGHGQLAFVPREHMAGVIARIVDIDD